MYIVLCCARVREIFLSPSREIHGGHNVSQQSYAVVKIFCPGKIAIPRSKKRSLPKDIVWLIPYLTGERERWSSCFFSLLLFLSPAKKTKSIARQFACPVWLVLSDCPFLVLFFFWRLLSTRLNFSAIQDCRLHWALYTQYTMWWLFPLASLKIAQWNARSFYLLLK